MVSFLTPEDIERWGLKAASVRYFSQNGLYTMPVTFVDRYESHAAIIEQLRQAGLKEEGWGMSIRFSSRKEGLYQLHRWALRTHSAVADFIEEHQHRLADGTFIVLEADVPEFMGNFLKRNDGSYHVEMVPGTWITSGVEPTDYIDITNGVVTFNAYQLPRRILARLELDDKNQVIMGQFIPRVDPPYTDQIVSGLAQKIWEASQRLTQADLPPHMYEFNMNADMTVHIREVKEIDERVFESALKHSEDVFEIDSHEKIDQWDGKSALYLTVGVEKSNANLFQGLVNRLKGRVDRVYVKYGVLTHPAILLREAGITPVSLRSQYKQYRFEFGE